jgi:hypothetical protein
MSSIAVEEAKRISVNSVMCNPEAVLKPPKPMARLTFSIFRDILV